MNSALKITLKVVQDMTRYSVWFVFTINYRIILLGLNKTKNLSLTGIRDNLIYIFFSLGQVTADGSIDCQDDPGEQEQIVSCLHYCEALAGILILSTGGHMVIKKFTMFESQSISLMYILCCLFKEVRYQFRFLKLQYIASP